MITRYVQQLDAGRDIGKAESQLCMMSDSIQGTVAFVGDYSDWPELDLSGKSMTEVFRSSIKRDIGAPERPLVAGLISAAKMSVLPNYEGSPSLWEGDQWPMVIHHDRPEKGWTGAYQGCEFDLVFGKKPVPVWGLDWTTEMIYRRLSENDQQAYKDCSINPQKASVESLTLPLEQLTDRQKLRRQACDEFKF